MYPQYFNCSINPKAPVYSGIDTTVPHHHALSQGPLTLVFSTQATHTSNLLVQNQITDLQNKSTNLMHQFTELSSQLTEQQSKIKTLTGAIETLTAEIDKVRDATLPLLPLSLRCVLDAHLFQLGFDLDNLSSSCSAFISNNVGLASALGIPVSQLKHCFEYVSLPFLLLSLLISKCPGTINTMQAPQFTPLPLSVWLMQLHN
jgi:uncharacterized coiled-coil protein SlyX